MRLCGLDYQTDIISYQLPDGYVCVHISFIERPFNVESCKVCSPYSSSEIQAKTCILSLAKYSPAKGFASLCQIVPCQSVYLLVAKMEIFLKNQSCCNLE